MTVSSYCTIDDLSIIQELKLLNNDNTISEPKITEWIQQSSDMINKYCNDTFDTNTPPTITNCCIRLTTNMITFAKQRAKNNIIKINDWSIGPVSSNIFTQDIKDDLEYYVKDISNARNSGLNCFIIHGRYYDSSND